MNDEILNAEHYYKLRIAHQTHLKSLSIADLECCIGRARTLLNDARFTTSFEQERLIDFIDEVEVHIENFEKMKDIRHDEKEMRKSVSKFSPMSKELIHQIVYDRAIKEDGVFQDSNGDVFIIIQKDKLKNLKDVIEKSTVIAAIISSKTFREGAKMLGLTERAFRFMRKKYGI